MQKGLTVQRLSISRFSVFDSSTKQTTVYGFDEHGIMLCESGHDHSQYRYAVRRLLSLVSGRAA